MLLVFAVVFRLVRVVPAARGDPLVLDVYGLDEHGVLEPGLGTVVLLLVVVATVLIMPLWFARAKELETVDAKTA